MVFTCMLHVAKSQQFSITYVAAQHHQRSIELKEYITNVKEEATSRGVTYEFVQLVAVKPSDKVFDKAAFVQIHQTIVFICFCLHCWWRLLNK